MSAALSRDDLTDDLGGLKDLIRFGEGFMSIVKDTNIGDFEVYDLDQAVDARYPIGTPEPVYNNELAYRWRQGEEPDESGLAQFHFLGGRRR